MVPRWIATGGDTDRDLRVARLAGTQSDVRAAEGMYLQVLSGMSGTPEDEVALAVDDSVKPSDRATSPADWGITRPVTSTVATSIDIYPGGWGVRQAARDSGSLWHRVEWQLNPSGAPDLPWTEAPPPDGP